MAASGSKIRFAAFPGETDDNAVIGRVGVNFVVSDVCRDHTSLDDGLGRIQLGSSGSSPCGTEGGLYAAADVDAPTDIAGALYVVSLKSPAGRTRRKATYTKAARNQQATTKNTGFLLASWVSFLEFDRWAFTQKAVRLIYSGTIQNRAVNTTLCVAELYSEGQPPLHLLRKRRSPGTHRLRHPPWIQQPLCHLPPAVLPAAHGWREKLCAYQNRCP